MGIIENYLYNCEFYNFMAYFYYSKSGGKLVAVVIMVVARDR